MNDSLLKLTSAEVALYYRTHVPHLGQTLDQQTGLWTGSCPICLGRDAFDFTVTPSTGAYFCESRCGEGGDVNRLDLALYGGSLSESRTRICHTVGRLMEDLTEEQEKEVAAKCRRDRKEAILAAYWHRGSLLTIEQRLETDKRWLFQSEGETHERLAKAVRSNTLKEQQLQNFNRSELLSTYRQENAADPVLASLMVRLGQDDRKDIRSLAATLVGMVEVQRARERGVAA